MTATGAGAKLQRRSGIGLWLACLLAVMLLVPLIPYTSADRGNVPNPGADLWRDVRQREGPVTGTTQVKGVDTGVLINARGEQWRQFRMQTLVPVGGMVLGAAVGLIAVFYLVRGTVRVPGGRSGKRIQRFTEYDRILHWATVFLFYLLAITGLVLLYGRFVLIPLLGPDGFAITASACKEAHNLFGPLFFVVLVLLVVNFIRSNLPKWVDIKWLLKGGGLFGGHASAGYFNGGEKIWFWLVTLFGLAISVSGFILVFQNFDQGRVVMEISHVIHGSLALLLVAGSFGHAYIGTLGMEGSLESMTTGSVDANWAQAHHDLWMQEREARGLDPESTSQPKHKSPPGKTAAEYQT
jgi:formate dehydrogenase subunit gamma